jgi:hypothetical protein
MENDCRQYVDSVELTATNLVITSLRQIPNLWSYFFTRLYLISQFVGHRIFPTPTTTAQRHPKKVSLLLLDSHRLLGVYLLKTTNVDALVRRFGTR